MCMPTKPPVGGVKGPKVPLDPCHFKVPSMQVQTLHTGREDGERGLLLAEHAALSALPTAVGSLQVGDRSLLQCSVCFGLP